MQFHNHDRQLISLQANVCVCVCVRRRCIKRKMQKMQKISPGEQITSSMMYSVCPLSACEAHHTVASAYMQFHNHDRQLISLCESQKCHAAYGRIAYATQQS